MRKDMAKVIVERPRLGSAKVKVRPYGDMETERIGKRSITEKGRFYWGERRQLNENLKPLVRFLRSRVGMPYAKVYGEICENLKKTSTVQDHLFTHLRDYVEIHTFFRDGEV